MQFGIFILVNQQWKLLLGGCSWSSKYRFILCLSMVWVGYTYNRDGNRAFHGSKTPNLVTIIICQDYSE
ncbi:hypothetical protein Gogos_022288 [Gossypium gossypioides]|uniref:Uncharacterized protein n=1 Tax=Gossypium gossypioides TaxID=34282 RepID=A0A7J9D2C5_GOSGO|nr:hypothetical protein [Gossypium gossypioides]